MIATRRQDLVQEVRNKPDRAQQNLTTTLTTCEPQGPITPLQGLQCKLAQSPLTVGLNADSNGPNLDFKAFGV